MRAALLTSFLVLCTCACPAPTQEAAPTRPTTPTAGSPDRTEPGPLRAPLVDRGDPLYGRVEGQGLQNACTTDSECFAGGCSGEICSAEQGASSTCDAPAAGFPSTGGACGCIEGQCLWYRNGGVLSTGPGTATEPGTASEPTPTATRPAQGEPCPDGACQDGLTCLTYYGIAGTRGPKFTSCEIRCTKESCPNGQRCVVIADGPGQVCRP